MTTKTKVDLDELFAECRARREAKEAKRTEAQRVSAIVEEEVQALVEELDAQRSDLGLGALIKCPECGVVTSIYPNGTVSPREGELSRSCGATAKIAQRLSTRLLRRGIKGSTNCGSWDACHPSALVALGT